MISLPFPRISRNKITAPEFSDPTIPAGRPRKINAHAWDRSDKDWYVEPSWCSRRLFEEEKFKGPIWDPACGFGTIPESARAIVDQVYATDIVDRGYAPKDAA
jgi:hypothetical protein